MKYMMGLECCEDEILSSTKSKSGSMGDATIADLENGYSVVERGAPKKPFMLMDDDCCDGGVLGRPNGFER